MMRGGVPRAALDAPWRYLVLGVLFALYFVLMFEGLKTAPAVSAAAVFTLTPLMAAGFGWLMLRQRVYRRIKMALAIGAIGALWVIFRADVAALLRFEVGRGELIYFVGCVAHAYYTPLVRQINSGETALVFTFGTLVASATILTVVGWSDLMVTDWAHLPVIVWVTILYTAVFATAATSTLLQFSAMQLPASKVMAYTYLVPSWVIVWTVALGGQMPPFAVFVGVALTVVALVLLLRDEG
jgi:drug/metabolite transporter (DMT)-like permease